MPTTPHAPPRTTTDGGVLLADALSLNLLLSAATGTALTVGAGALAPRLGLPWQAVLALGLGLLLFADGILLGLLRPAALRPTARAVLAADAAWLVGAAVVLPSGLLADTGDVLLAVVTVAVAGVAAGQWLGLRRVGDVTTPGVRPVSLTATRTVPVDADSAWALVADGQRYAAFAPGLSETTVDGPLAEGMRRVCTDDGGSRWEERCRLLVPGRRYRMEVDTDTYPLRHRVLLHDLGMTWDVAPTSDGTRLTLTFSGHVRLGVLGRAAGRLLTAGDPVTTIVERYAAALSDGADRSTGVAGGLTR